MVKKAQLTSLTKNWIDGKTEKLLDSKTEKHLYAKDERPKEIIDDKAKQTIYISKTAIKLLWHNRAETGNTISRAIEQLVLKHLAKA